MPLSIMESVAAAVAACLEAQPGEFSGAHNVTLDERGAAGDPDKAALSVSYELTHTGACQIKQPSFHQHAFGCRYV